MVTGVSFSPLSQPTGNGQSVQPQASVQDAIRLLSLNLPSVLSGAGSGVLGAPTALGPALGGTFGQQSFGRQKVQPVPLVNAGMNPAQLLAQLLGSLGIPSMGGAAPAKVQFQGPPQAMPGLASGPSGNPLASATETGGWNGPATGGLSMTNPSPLGGRTETGGWNGSAMGGLSIAPQGGFGSPFRTGGQDYQLP